jgi:hypothetical protein
MNFSEELRLPAGATLVLCGLLVCIAGCAESGAQNSADKREQPERMSKDAQPESPSAHLLLSQDNLVSAALEPGHYLELQGLKKDAAVLLANWPTTNGVLPYLGRYRIYDNEADCLSLDPPETDYCTVGWNREIVRTSDGGLVFDYIDGKIEYHPNGGKPASYARSYWRDGREVLRLRWYADRYVELEPDWFFVTYSTNRVGE